jgi:hypothetical protein
VSVAPVAYMIVIVAQYAGVHIAYFEVGCIYSSGGNTSNVLMFR